ncbi:MAG TPA: GNAT family N-acetyltransferase [Propionibacteriaceae bacterium]|nr:GNAT family N-acetyltransferase [Propionibacteriaceae bacterium]
MSVHRPRLWRAAPTTLAVVVTFMVTAAITVPMLAYLAYALDARPLIPILVGALTIAALLYAWRFGLHPRLIATGSGLVVKNPLSTSRVDWDDITLIAPGENGLVIGTPDQRLEAWCIQKSNYAAKRHRRTRADAICGELLGMLDDRDRELDHPDARLRIRRARPDETSLLTWLERSATESTLAGLFGPDGSGYPSGAVRRRWRRLLNDRTTRVAILEHLDEPIGLVAYDSGTVGALAVLPEYIGRGFRGALEQYATRDIFDSGTRQAELWVLIEDETARSFYRSHGWLDRPERRDWEMPPHAEEVRMVKPNASAPRRSRAL